MSLIQFCSPVLAILRRHSVLRNVGIDLPWGQPLRDTDSLMAYYFAVKSCKAH